MVSRSYPSPGPLLLLAGIFHLNFISRILLAPLLPEIEVALSISHGQAGTFFLCISIGYFVALFGSGFVSVRFGHKRSIVASMSALGLSLVLVSLSPSLPLLQVSFFLLGMAAGLFTALLGLGPTRLVPVWIWLQPAGNTVTCSTGK